MDDFKKKQIKIKKAIDDMITHFQTQADACEAALPGLNASYTEASEKVDDINKQAAAYEVTWAKHMDEEQVIANMKQIKETKDFLALTVMQINDAITEATGVK